jgi:anti-repressor protein
MRGEQMDDQNQFELLVKQKAEEQLQEMLKNPLVVIKAYQQALITADEKIKDMEPKAEFYDTVTRSDTEFLMRHVAKILNFKNMGEKKLFQFLRDKKILNSSNMPYQSPHVDAGRFSYKENKWKNPYTGETIVVKTPVVTQKGMDYIRKILEGEGYEYNER